MLEPHHHPKEINMAENFYTELKVGGSIPEVTAVVVLDIIGNNFTEGTFKLTPNLKLLEGNGDMSYNEFEEIVNSLRKLNVAFTFTMYPRDDYPGILLYNYPNLNLSGQTASDGNGHPIIRIDNVRPIVYLMMDLLKEGTNTLAKHINDEHTKDLVTKILQDKANLIPIMDQELNQVLPELPDLPELTITEALS
jgi:hypothetical protein